MQAAVGQLPLERIPATFPGDDRNREERQWYRFGAVGFQYFLTILAMTGIGIWLDNQFETAPLFLLVLLALAFVGATYSLIRQVLDPGKKPPKGTKP
ncbi:MAG TPA: AtpZ/AtpI family protein [Acidimicrobiia bacterium]|nr:AtpZ/AtpI family protein [Acidimicrobiia bacterium]